MDAGELAKLVTRCVAMAREAPEDPYAGLAPEELLFKGAIPDLDLDDGSEADPQSLREAALGVEEAARAVAGVTNSERSEEHTSELQLLMRISYAVFCLKKKKPYNVHSQSTQTINCIYDKHVMTGHIILTITNITI